MVKKYLIIFVAFSIGLVGLIVIYHKVGLVDISTQLHKLHLWQLFLVLGTSIAMMTLTICRWGLILIDLNQKKTSWLTMIKARLGEFAFSYLTPIAYFGGEWIRAYVMNKDKNVPVSTSLTSIFLDRISEFVAAFLFIFFGAIVMAISRSFIWGILMLIFSGIIFSGLYLAIVLVGLDKILIFLVNFLKLNKIRYSSKNAGQTTIGERFIYLGGQVNDYFKKSRAKFVFTTFLSFLTLLVWLWQTKLIINFLGIDLSWSKIFIIKIFLATSMFMPIPANLGSYEGAHVLVFNIFGLPSDSALALSVVNRALDLVWITAGIFMISHSLTQILAKILQAISNFSNRNGQSTS
ncbi:MAG: lysylphosphatidylglycerol synthase transmembrane domain-containing protein [Patescibacteria group bacterium]|nr:lysylphosphatidylglycerol synthase transmembrane domain-containing protein [Patescibacteria group bacterium]MDD5121651.1 lysylphosphatidylglycerol synthase transmembrane domain-containing protein [Patescibacteria group bacterium]MDD5222131.1 lysylphosphatidylglycerol synthase transmembrane domain-containing protein [Patescibacteria group bacterium]MDD5396185.1 lysylphosphatidylglycerol synthase transmembrane domain-containing protein [Patescibacteria group bacterium]